MYILPDVVLLLESAVLLPVKRSRVVTKWWQANLPTIETFTGEQCLHDTFSFPVPPICLPQPFSFPVPLTLSFAAHISSFFAFLFLFLSLSASVPQRARSSSIAKIVTVDN